MELHWAISVDHCYLNMAYRSPVHVIYVDPCAITIQDQLDCGPDRVASHEVDAVIAVFPELSRLP